jgi:hypothetical protein
LAVGAGLQVMQTLMEADVTALAGPKGRQDPALCRAPAGRVGRAVLVLDVMPSAGQLPTEVHLAVVAGVIVDHQPQVRLLAW